MWMKKICKEKKRNKVKIKFFDILVLFGKIAKCKKQKIEKGRQESMKILVPPPPGCIKLDQSPYKCSLL
jgi:hypothetical protein